MVKVRVKAERESTKPQQGLSPLHHEALLASVNDTGSSCLIICRKFRERCGGERIKRMVEHATESPKLNIWSSASIRMCTTHQCGYTRIHNESSSEQGAPALLCAL